MTSATEVLRRLLDERGVEHYDGTERTLWGYEQTGENTGVYRFAASEISGGFLQFDMFRITPEQAIEATLGRGTCRDVGKGWMWRCSECKCRLDIDRDDLPTMWVDNVASVPHYCPNCGREVVNDQ